MKDKLNEKVHIVQDDTDRVKGSLPKSVNIPPPPCKGKSIPSDATKPISKT